MKRREFLTRVTIGGVTLPLLFTEIGCSDDGGGPDGGVETFTSSSTSGHTHTISIPDADIAAGEAHSYTSSNNSGHTHTVSLSSTEVDGLAVGCALTKTSSLDSGHTHTWRVTYPDLASDITKDSEVDTTGHRHRVTVPAADFTNPTGLHNYTTSAAGSGPHTHQVTLTQIDLVDLEECNSVEVVTTSDASGHTHTFRITRV